MMVSTKGRYALRVMIDLAESGQDNYISLKSIAQRQDISEKYLESIISLLVKSGLVEGVRGKGGGYRLTRAPEQYTAEDILRVAEGTLAPVACLACTPNQCAREPDCKSLPVWQKLDDIIHQYLSSLTLAEIARAERDNHGPVC